MGNVDDLEYENLNVGSSTNPTGGILLDPEVKLKMSSKMHSVSPALNNNININRLYAEAKGSTGFMIPEDAYIKSEGDSPRIL